jgi:ADP-ribosylation factor GTPase-activating protein 1
MGMSTREHYAWDCQSTSDCVDSVQASPKFGIFICLSCSGIHRGLGVHISFVRSISMDAFKAGELARMEVGGNKPFRDFWEKHESNTLEGRTWDDSTIRERYESEVGEEWKARLTAKIEDRDYIPGEEKKNMPAPKKPYSDNASMTGSRSATPTGVRGGAISAGGAISSGGALLKVSSNAGSRSGSPALGTASLSRKTQNEAFFAKMGADNASRPDDLPPSEGGKFSGFGSDWQPPPRSQPGVVPGTDEFQKDPIAALTKSFGWFGGVVQKGVGDGLQKVSLI